MLLKDDSAELQPLTLCILIIIRVERVPDDPRLAFAMLRMPDLETSALLLPGILRDTCTLQVTAKVLRCMFLRV
ncbi:hypothetical protein QCN29_23160 [Streptomyces sp. HNM0663]|uniref:Uncharacterized protein n=1 Tax=Streptomyces chengmaiensis TaxID=3040919 RepID=A0ABT6HSR3_9ACTN|nr:hypothetical protein [Streptomyces chengmaiensis]MDH2391625.1 hypothetical protein [Streptomyces chengmaiensis]